MQHDKNETNKQEAKNKWEEFAKAMKGPALPTELPCVVKYLQDQTKAQTGETTTKLHVLNIDHRVGNEAVYYALHGFQVTEFHIHPHSREETLQTLSQYPEIKIKDLNVDEVFDVVSAMFCLPWLDKDSMKVFCEKALFDFIKPGGYFVGNFFGLEHDWTKSYPRMSFLTIDEVKAMFDPNKTKFAGFVKICDHYDGFTEAKEKDTEHKTGKVINWHTFFVVARKKPELGPESTPTAAPIPSAAP